MTEGRKVGGPQESGLTGGERASRRVRAAPAYHTCRCTIRQWLACLGALATAHVVKRGVAETVVYLKLICQSLKYIRGYR